MNRHTSGCIRHVAALYLNRTNRSGIIDGGVIGGLDQSAKWGIDARFNAEDLVARMGRIARYASRIHLYQSEAQHSSRRPCRS